MLVLAIWCHYLSIENNDHVLSLSDLPEIYVHFLILNGTRCIFFHVKFHIEKNTLYLNSAVSEIFKFILKLTHATAYKSISFLTRKVLTSFLAWLKSRMICPLLLRWFKKYYIEYLIFSCTFCQFQTAEIFIFQIKCSIYLYYSSLVKLNSLFYDVALYGLNLQLFEIFPILFDIQEFFNKITINLVMNSNSQLKKKIVICRSFTKKKVFVGLQNIYDIDILNMAKK